MAPLEVYDPSTPPSSSPSSSAATCDSSESSDDNSAPVVSRSKNPGRRLIGGRIYDSVLGVTCHWCRQKTVEDHVFCCHCNIAFCGGCLRNRHGEDVEVEMKDDVEWTCPKCRGGCGRGCKNCCNCGPCRKAQGLEPTGLLVHTARARGFTNVHDYLIHQKTGESEEKIAKRKQGKGWCQTNPSSFRKKQIKDADDTGVDASCRKRLKFTLSDNDLQGKKWDTSPHANALQIKEANPGSNTSKDEKLSQGGSLQNKDGGLKEQKSKVLCPPSANPLIVQPKPEPDLHAHKEPCKNAATSLPGKDTNVEPHSLRNIVQPKPGPDLHVKEEPRRSGAATSSLEKATDVQPHSQCEMRSSPSAQHHPSAQTDVIPRLHVKEEPITYENVAQQLVIVKKEPCEPDSRQPKHGASSNAVGTLMKVKTEEAPLRNETLVSEQVTKDRHLLHVKERGQITEGLNAQLMRVKEESQDQCSQPICGNVSTNNPNVFAAAFSRGECDAAWCRFSVDFEVPSENEEGPISTSAFSETPRNTGDARSSASPSTSNFHLSPGNLLPVFSHVKKELVDGQHALRSDVAVKLESVSSQEAQCNTAPCRPPVTNKGHKDGSMDAIQSHISFPGRERMFSIATVKEEREEGWNVHCPAPVAKSTMNASHTNSLLSNVKVKAERGDFSFTIAPSLCPSISKSGGLPVSQVKEEVIIDTPMSKVICIDEDEARAVSGKDKAEIPVGLKKSSSLGGVSHLWKVDDFKNKLEAKLLEPFSRKELEELAAAASHRKPIYKARETRQGCSQFVSEEEGYSYLDHHPDLDLQLKEASSPMARLSLLRGFFFWLEHASTHGAFKPWTSVSRSPEVRENDDCVEIEGPDCEILAVVCSVDEEVSGENGSSMRMKSAIVL